MAIPETSQPLLWTGAYASGAPLPAGLYRFQAESYANGELLEVGEVESYGRVTEARVENGETVLILNGGVRVPSADITALREPQ